MTGWTHLLAGMVAGMAFTGDMVAGTAITMIGSILPDIDCKNSLLGRYVPAWIVFNHRGFLHSYIAAIIAWMIHPALGLGYTLHLAMDRVRLPKFRKKAR